mmetsp:Transcript_47771/g.55019  ORF Transcript_47771/g.55019 Transcript_47771/m.55019 type:complete len:80 (+) Transcript_47771:2-241(+)
MSFSPEQIDSLMKRSVNGRVHFMIYDYVFRGYFETLWRVRFFHLVQMLLSIAIIFIEFKFFGYGWLGPIDQGHSLTPPS